MYMHSTCYCVRLIIYIKSITIIMKYYSTILPFTARYFHLQYIW